MDRYLVASAVVLTCTLFLTSALDPVNVIKLTALLLVAIALVVSIAVRVLRDREVHLPVSAAGAVAAALALAFVVSAAVAPVTNTAVLGAYGRNSGLLAYLAALVLFVVGLRVFDRPGARVLVGGIVFAGLFTAVYGLLQKNGIDRVPWNNPFNPIIAGLGNPNFAAGYLGIAASVAAGGALWRGWAVGWRALSAATTVLCLVAAALSSSAQGPVAAAGGLFVVALAWVLDLPGIRRTTGLAFVVGGAAVAGTALLIGAFAKAGPAARLFADVGSQARVHYWDAALNMFAERPLLGVGLDQYGNFWRSERTSESVTLLGGPSYSDAAHSVPLQMLAQGGLLLGAVYLALLLVTASALVRGLLRLRGADRMLLGAVGGGWAAYQVQSFVSIDQVPLLVLHFALAGAVIAVSGTTGMRSITLPGALKPVAVHPNDARARRRAVAAPRRRDLDGADAVGIALVGVVAVFAAYQSLEPLRANRAAKAAADAIQQGDGVTALAAYDKAKQLVPGQAYYSILEGNLFETAQPPQPARAEASYRRAAEVDPYEVNAVKGAATLAERNGDVAEARSLFDRALELDPYNDETVELAAQFELRQQGAERARELLETALQRLPRSAKVLANLGDARAALGDQTGARQAYEQALAIDPAQPVAIAGVAKLAA